MTAPARTPEELDALLEDAFVLRDRFALDGLFDDAAALEAGGLEARGSEAIGGALAKLWTRDCTYVAHPRRVLQTGDLALVISDAGIHVLRRGSDGGWRAALSVLELDGPVSHNQQQGGT